MNEFTQWPISVENGAIHRETSNFSVYFRNVSLRERSFARSGARFLRFEISTFCVVISGLWCSDVTLFFTVDFP